jgi:predicted lipoprotein with Yx(FWY)xxD motif
VLAGLAGLGAVALFAAACGGGGTAPGAAAGAASSPAAGYTGGAGYGAPPPSAPGPTAATAAVTTRRVPLGTILTDPAGRSLYLFAADTGTTSTCAGACAQAWPPLLTTADASAGVGVMPSLLGTTRRGDGTLQVTYAGHPLYRYAGDSAAGQTHGEGLKVFGAGWYVLTPQGTEIDDD